MGVPVWLLSTTFEPRGASLYTLSLATRLPELGFEPLIVCEDASKIGQRVRRKLAIREFPRIRNRLLGIWSLRRLLAEFQDQRPALIHAQRRTLDALAMSLARKLDRPYLITIQDILPVGESLVVNADYLAGVIAVSPSVERDLVVGAHVPKELVHMIPNGVEMPQMPVLPPPRPPEKIPVVGCVSALEPVKGIMYLLMAAELILASGEDVEFLIVGSGPDEEALRRAAQVLEIASSVTFVSHVEETKTVLDVIDVFVVPSIEQGLGTVMIQAMSLGKPVVATKVGGIADFFVDGEHALLVPPSNHKALADRITFLLNNPERARRLAMAGQELVREKFAADRMTQQTAGLYHATIDRWVASSLDASTAPG
jgi:glycosyltransferase involved in cell wall biosynthesis